MDHDTLVDRAARDLAGLVTTLLDCGACPQCLASLLREASAALEEGEDQLWAEMCADNGKGSVNH